MPTKDQLSEMHLVDLAALCGRITKASSTDTDTRQKAQDLVREWARLEIPPPYSLEEKEKNEAKKRRLKERIVEFLVGINIPDELVRGLG